jgi:flagellar biosynthesis/type III secretory pathway protein FliH
MLQGLGIVKGDVGEARKRGYQDGMRKGRVAGYDEGFQAGYERGAAENRVTFRCSGCKESIAIPAGSPAAEAAADALERNGWGHDECVR